MGQGSSHPTQTLNAGEEDQLIVTGFRRSFPKTVVTWVAVALSAGILRLVFYWMKHWMLYWTHAVCNVADADHLLLQDIYKQKLVCQVKCLDVDALRTLNAGTLSPEQNSVISPLGNGLYEDVQQLQYFDDRRMRYIWNPEKQCFRKLMGLDENLQVAYFQTCAPLLLEETLRRLLLYRPNEIDIQLTPIIKILAKQVLNPFYIFQVFSICLWCSYGYYYYAGAIFVTTTCSLALTTYETRKTEQMLRDRVNGGETLEVCRPDGTTSSIGSEKLVPGDVFLIPAQGGEVLCDAVLLTGSAIVNESALTGESIPVTKTAIPAGGDMFDIKDYQRHVLYSGTKILQTRFYGNEPVKAVVLRTGFATSKGTLIRSIMFAKPVDFKFYRHTYYFIMLLGGIALCGLIYSAILRALRGQPVSEIIIRSLDVITIAVPPALPAALSVGVVYAQRRLKNSRIFCLSPRAINICGSINLVCFDKTGTLTQDGLDLKCVVQCSDDRFEEPVNDPTQLSDGVLKDCMAACHSLMIIQGTLSGDPVDLIMFNSVGWKLTEPQVAEESRFDLVAPTVVTGPSSLNSEDEHSIGIIRDFPFASNLQRMSTIVRRLGDQYFVYLVKGAPEKVITLCRPETVPEDFVERLESFTRQGDRVLAVAWKKLENINFVKIQKVLREELDVDLFFVGFVVMENRLKSDTNAVISQLHQANIRTVMITGDNMHTAISVARECGMVQRWDDVQIITASEEAAFWSHSDGGSKPGYEDVSVAESEHNYGSVKLPRQHLAVSGDSFNSIRAQYPSALKKVLAHGTVFARMSPIGKERLVEEFQKAGFFVAMCGDGANDCGALKAAHTGVSLSESEAAAAAPFTACTGSISCIPEIIKEGRAALVTSFGIFKYMAAYSLAQFFSVILLYSIATNFSDLQFLYIDFFQVLILSATFGRSKAFDRLSRTPPPTSLMAFIPLFSVFLQVVVIFGIQLAAFFVAYDEKDSTSYEIMYPNHTGSPPFFSKENFAVYSVSTFQYVWLAIAFAKGPPYRKMMYKNKIFCLCAAVMIGFDAFLLLGPTEPIKWLLELLPPVSWGRRLTLLGIVISNAAISILCEKLFLDYLLFQKCGKKFAWIRNSKMHQDVSNDLLNEVDDHWWDGLEKPPSGHALGSAGPRDKLTPNNYSAAYSNPAFLGDSKT